jgi:NADH-quinone oxidoreductase subunit F
METPLTNNFQEDRDPLDIKAYIKAGGYRSLDKVLNSMQPSELTELVKSANLKGRGGAGFNTGMKWGFVPLGDDAPKPKYLVANADEMEPGTFKDRILMEGDPHQLIEGMILAAYAIEAEVAYIFIRWAYQRSQHLLNKAIKEACDQGFPGRNIRGSGYNLDMHMHVSAGRYMCGEETGLLNALEGKRATPRAKPPFPQLSGLWGKPTIVQNVETLCNIPHIVNHGAGWFHDLSKSSEEGGTKIYGVSGKVRQPGAWELPLGTTIREILEEYAGGMRDGVKFKGLLPGGGSTDFLVSRHLDIPMDFSSVQNAGSRLGTGTMIILDDQTCPVAMLHCLELFFARESCGWCTPCRDGLPWVADILQGIENGEGREEDLEILASHAGLLGPGNTFCALAPGAVEPLQSGLNYFRDDFERHITDKKCPYGH